MKLTSFALALVLPALTLSKPVDAQEASKEDLSAEVAKLKQQMSILANALKNVSENQKVIAREIGLIKPEQPSYSGPIEFDYSVFSGDKNADIVIMEFTDLQCPYCKKHHQLTYPKIKEQFIDTGDVLYANNQYPLASLHPQAEEAAKYLVCADEQGGFIKAKDGLFSKGESIQKRDFLNIPGLKELDHEKLTACVSEEKTQDFIEKSKELAIKVGVKQTPSFIIGLKKDSQLVEWKILGGAEPFENFKSVIESLKNKS